MATMKKTSMQQAHLSAEQRIQVLAAIAAQAQGGVTPKAQQERAARRAYRQDTLGIKDLREATAGQVEAAQHDPKALLSAQNVAAQRNALAYAQVHGGTGQQQAAPVTPGKPAGPTVLGGRPVVVAGQAAPPPLIVPPSRMTTRKRIKNTLVK